MRMIETEELKRIQIDILKDVHDFCSRNDIHYSLAYGTLLGAIRHKGYIPWDDDIDIMMPRQDYEIFLRTFPGSFEHLNICAPEIDLNYYAPYANVWDNRTVLEEGVNTADHRGQTIGIKIDVFPIDKTSSSRLFELHSRILYKLWYSHRYRKSITSEHRFNFVYICLNLIADIIGYKNIQKLIIHNAKRYMNSNSQYLDMLAFYNVGSRAFKSIDFNKYIEVPFENYFFFSIAGFDDYLKCAYGDYMQLPPEGKRVSHHSFTAYWK